MKTIKDFRLSGKKVVIRCDFNVPIEDGKITDETRIVESLKTIRYAIDHKAKVILLSHLGRVKEESDLKKNDLKIVSKRLEKLLGCNVTFINETRGKELEDSINKMNDGDIILVQNTRYEDLDGKKESSNDKELGEYWSSLGDIFINDAFGTCHRAHASNVGIATNIEKKGIGFLIEKELAALSSLKRVKRPFIIILGGAKVSDKIGVIKKLVTKADYILIGGGMAFTFLQSEGFNIGSSLVDKDSIDFCKSILEDYEGKIILPVDVMTNTSYADCKSPSTKLICDIEDDEMGLDIGPKTVELFKKYLNDAKTVLWNGPLGVCEFEHFKNSTYDILSFLVENDIKTIVGGGDTAAVASLSNLKDKLYHVSTGGGATLEYLEGKKLPGIESIK